jgi:hypothetical protein
VVKVYQAPKRDRVRVQIGGAEVLMQDPGAYRFDAEAGAPQQWAAERGTPPAWIPRPAMLCLSRPAKLTELEGWMKECGQR